MMEMLALFVVAVFLSGGTYLLLDRTLLRVIIGLALLSNGVNLLIMSASGLRALRAPLLDTDMAGAAGLAFFSDPLPQALVLTAIVIGFGVTALLIVLAYRNYQSNGSDDLGELHGVLPDE